jgi:dipeptidyl aminopeptidase/acylaminoacyl peptidase
VEYNDPITPPDIYRIEIPDKPVQEVPKNEFVQLTHSDLPALAHLPKILPQFIEYRSYDGLTIPALLYKPEKPNGAAILHPHGGPRDQYTVEWDSFVQYLVAKGYTFLAVNYRGSTGFGLDFELANQDSWGIGDTQDCLFGARYLAGLEWIGEKQIAIMGSSYGGYLVTCCLTRDPEYLFRCGISFYGDADLFSSWAQTERDTRLYTEMQLDHPSRNFEVYEQGSPIYQAEYVQAPILIFHGLEDQIVPPMASEEWVDALKRADKTYEYRTYAHESHGFLKKANVLDSHRLVERFLDWYLMP